MSPDRIIGSEMAGSPCGKGPNTGTPALVDRLSNTTIRVAPTTASKTPGKRFQRFNRRIADSVPTPSADETQFER